MGEEIPGELFTTGDGSHSVYAEKFGEPYHSRHGAIQESNHVFIESGLSFINKNKSEINIFEMGYGTGLNGVLTSIYARENKIKVNYQAIEKFPLSEEKIASLNYFELLDISQTFYLEHHKNQEGINKNIHSHFHLELQEGDLNEIELPSTHFDLIYFDAFAPAAQPELWTEAVFAKLFRCLKPGGILTTYCAKGIVKRAMKAAGFIVEGIPGPPGKREMTRCLKPA